MGQTNLSLNPYLFFGGNCREAMEFYKSVFGGELNFKTYEEGPEDAHSDPKANGAEMKNKIMHARLEGAITLLASDDPQNPNIKNSGQLSLSLEGFDKDNLTKYFNKLSDGGKIAVPLAKQFWGDTFGMLTDKFGVSWMISIRENNYMLE